MGSRADEEMDAAIEAMGLNSEPARIEHPESEWDESKWRKSNLREDDTMAKGKAKTMYLLTDKDLLPLQYQKQMNSRGFNGMKMYKNAKLSDLAGRNMVDRMGSRPRTKEDKKNGVKPVSPKKTGKATSSAKGKSPSSSLPNDE
ncbi:hypothetical protein B0H12DRAFT_1142642 [Mycena haematopus]|nr:hypothetical protein B0H12DRAFT_1142642 [Mycena haematopus]